MKRGFSYAQMGISVISMTLWFLLPIFSFVVIVPLFHISGWNLCMHINQIMLISLGISILMLIAALINHRTLMIVAGLLQAVFAILTIVFRKDFLLEGNLKWIYSSAQLLLNAIPNLNVSGVQITSESLREVVQLIADNYMQMGIGFILHAVCVLIYILIAFMAPAETKPFSSSIGGENMSSGTPTFTPKTKTGYNHRT